MHGEKAAIEEEAKRPKPPPLTCRFCGKRQAAGSTAWKVLKAPADSGGPNAAVPPPLREVSYCPTHYRSWLSTAHLTMSTNVIFSHLMQRAKPVFGASKSDETEMASTGGGGSSELAVPEKARKRNYKVLDRRMRSNQRKKRRTV